MGQKSQETEKLVILSNLLKVRLFYVKHFQMQTGKFTCLMYSLYNQPVNNTQNHKQQTATKLDFHIFTMYINQYLSTIQSYFAI